MSASQLFQLSFANSRWICSFRGFGLLLQRSNAPLRIGGVSASDGLGLGSGTSFGSVRQAPYAFL